MSQTVETVIIRAQQNFNVAGGLNPVQIEIEDDRIMNILRIYKNLINKVPPLGLLFLASPKQIFITGKEINTKCKKLWSCSNNRLI